MEYQPGQYGGPGGPVWSADVASNIAGNFTQWTEGFGREASMISQNQRVGETEAGADWRFSGSVLEKLAPFVKQRIQKNIDKRVSDGLESYHKIPELARIKADESFAKQQPELYAAAQRKADDVKEFKNSERELTNDQLAWQEAADNYWTKNSKKYMSTEIRESFLKQQWGNAYGFVKGQAIDLANLYDPENDPVVKGSESGTNFSASLNAKQRKEVIEPLKDINPALYATYVEPIIKRKNNAAYKNWHQEHAKDTFQKEANQRVKTFRDEIASGIDIPTAYTNMVKGSLGQFNGNVAQARAYANTLLVQYAGEELLTDNKIKELENLETTTFKGDKITLGNLVGKETFKQMRSVASERRKAALKKSDEKAKTDAGFFQLGLIDKVNNGMNINEALLQYYNSDHKGIKPDVLLEIQTSREQLRDVPIAKVKDHIQGLIDKRKFTMADLKATGNPELMSDKDLIKQIETYDVTWKTDQENLKGLINMVNDIRSGNTSLGTSEIAKEFGTELGKRYIEKVELRRSMEQPGEKEDLATLHNRIGEEVYKDLLVWADNNVKRGVSLPKLMNVLNNDKIGVDTALSKYDHLKVKRKAVNELLNEGSTDVANWTPGGAHGPDSNGIIDRSTLLDIQNELTTVAGNRGLYSGGTNIGGALKNKYHSPHPLIMQIAKQTGDSYYGALNKMLKAFDEDEIRLPDSIIEAEKMTPKARQLLNKALQYENSDMFNRAWVEGQFDLPADSEIGWNKAIVPDGLGDQVEEAAKANNQDPAEIASWVELLQANPDYMNFKDLEGVSESAFSYTIDERTKEEMQLERQQILAKYRKGQDVDLSPLIFSSLQYNR